MSENQKKSEDINRQHYWLMAGNVIAALPDNSQYQQGLNTLLVTDSDYVNRMDLAKTQRALTERFVKEVTGIKGAKIKDVFIIAVNYLGYMSQEEFHDGFPAQNPETEAKQPEKSEPAADALKAETLQ